VFLFSQSPFFTTQSGRAIYPLPGSMIGRNSAALLFFLRTPPTLLPAPQIMQHSFMSAPPPPLPSLSPTVMNGNRLSPLDWLETLSVFPLRVLSPLNAGEAFLLVKIGNTVSPEPSFGHDPITPRQFPRLSPYEMMTRTSPHSPTFKKNKDSKLSLFVRRHRPPPFPFFPYSSLFLSSYSSCQANRPRFAAGHCSR